MHVIKGRLIRFVKQNHVVFQIERN